MNRQGRGQMPQPFRIFVLLLAVAGFGREAAAATEQEIRQQLGRLIAETAGLEVAGVTYATGKARSFYAARGGAPVWWTPAGWSDRAARAVDRLQAAAQDGLRPRDYPAAFLLLPDPDGPPESLARAELLLSASLLRYVADVQVGRRAPSDLDPELRVPARRIDAVADLSAGLAAPDFSAWLATLPRSGAPYTALKAALARYRALAADGPWPLLGEGPKLEPGVRGPRVATLRRQLALLGDLAPELAAGDGFDADLDAALRSFQARHGLDVDGVAGPATRREIDRTPAERVLQIELNMERLRWLEEDLGRRHVLVNIADFRLTAVVERRVVFETPVVVGRDYRRTPVFSDRIVNLVLSPTWTVPPRIARLDLLPKIKAQPAFLQDRGFRVFGGWGPEAAELDPRAVDWVAISPEGLRFKFRQEPGPLNALGQIRFSLTNDFSIYLHDTPDKNLFSRTARAFSSGCIRVQDVLGLALFALDGDPDWPEARLSAAMESARTEIVKLAKPLPVHINYMTAWVDGAGRLQFRQDVYGRDRLLAEKLGLSER